MVGKMNHPDQELKMLSILLNVFILKKTKNYLLHYLTLFIRTWYYAKFFLLATSFFDSFDSNGVWSQSSKQSFLTRAAQD